MSNASEYFLKYKFDKKLLLNYGFNQVDHTYVLKKSLDSSLVIEIVIDENDNVSFSIYDNDFNEECTNYTTSEYIKALYVNEFENIKKQCGFQKKYLLEQANQIDQLIFEKLNVSSEFIFNDLPEIGVYRHDQSKKWFALIMEIDFSKIDKTKKGEINIVNFKSNNVKELLNKPGYYPAYHMNKAKWITTILNRTLGDEEIYNNIYESFLLTKK